MDQISTYSNFNKANINIAYDDLVKDLNNLFKNADNYISQLLKDQNITTRKRKLSFIDALTYKFMYANKHKTQQSAIDNYKYDNKIIFNNISFYKKESKIPLEYYEYIYDKCINMFEKYTNKTSFKIIAVDGTYNNTNYKNNHELETSLNMGYYDVLNCIPLKIDPICNKKNCEIKSFIDMINDEKSNLDDFIFVCDRAYFSYDLIKLLNQKNAKFVIRVKNNCKYMNNNCDIKDVSENLRFINFNFNKEHTKEFYNNKNDVFEKYKVIQKIDCNMITNLDNNFDDNAIKNIYNSRWDIEEYFKFIKYKFKFSLMKEHNKNTLETYKKTYTIIKIYSILERIFELASHNIGKKYNEKYNVKINKSQLINGIFKIIPKIISSSLTYDDLFMFYETYVHLNLTKKDSHNPRTSKIPFTL